MTITLNGTTGITTPAETVTGTDVWSVGSTQIYKDTSGNVGIGTSSPVMDGNGSLYVSAINSNGGTFNAGGSQSGTSNFVGSMQFVNTVLGTTDKRIATIAGITNGATNSGALTFNTWSSGSGAERARIDSSGNLLVGTTSLGLTNERLSVWASGSTSNAALFRFSTTDDRAVTVFWHLGASGATSRKMASFLNSSGTEVGYISSTGSATSYNTSSDYRLKENIAPMTGALAVVGQLKPCTYTWKENGSAGQGFIAHELQAVVPDCVTGEKDAVDADGNPVYQGIDTSFLVATLTAAIQELKAELDTVKTELATLKGTANGVA